MLIVLSPAKRLDFSPPPQGLTPSRPRFEAETAELAKAAQRLSRADLRRLMSISDKLAELNHERFQAFDPARRKGQVSAVFAFAGDVYLGLDARSLSPEQLAWAQGRLRILSGLYGLLRPLDRIQPYRLEMGSRLRTAKGATLYDFWDGKIADRLRADSRGHADKTVINLASQEYFGAVDARALKRPVVNVQFRETETPGGDSRIVSFFAKTARGMMARWAIEHRVETLDELKGFTVAGYAFQPKASSDSEWIFTRSGKS